MTSLHDRLRPTATVPAYSVAPTRLAATARLALVPFVLGTLIACAPLYGANFGYPSKVSVPEAATALVTEEGWDDDDPMRSHYRVIDIQDESLPALLDFYGQTYTISEGWTSVDVSDEQELCLVNRSDNRYTELLEVFPYSGTRLEVRPGRYLVIISRLHPGFGEEPCGAARAWVSSDLLETRQY